MVMLILVLFLSDKKMKPVYNLSVCINTFRYVFYYSHAYTPRINSILYSFLCCFVIELIFTSGVQNLIIHFKESYRISY